MQGDLEGIRQLEVIIVTPGGVFKDIKVNHLRAPGTEGDFGVLPGHLPFMTTLRIGGLYLDTDEGRQRWAVSGGFVQVMPDRVIILAQTAERAEEIDIPRAQAAMERAQERLKSRSPDLDVPRARAALARALNRLRIAKGEF